MQKTQRRKIGIMLESNFVGAIKHCRPLFGIERKKKGRSGIIYIPRYIALQRGNRLAVKWLSEHILRSNQKLCLTKRLFSG